MSAVNTFLLQNNFAIEFILSFVPFIPILKGRKLWYLILIPFIASILILSVFSFGLVIIESIWLNVLWYIAIYILAFAAMLFSFKLNIWQAVFTVTAAYTLQHTFFKINRIIGYVFANVSNAEIWDRIIYFPALALVYLAFYFIFVRRIEKQKSFEINNIRLLIITVIALFVIILVNLYFERLFFSLNMFNGSNNVYFSLFGIICCLLILNNLYDNIHNYNVEEELRILNTLWENDKRQYEIFKSSLDLINVKYHDLKYALKSVESENNEWLNETLENLDIYASIQKTGCEALDVVLFGIYTKCENSDIRLTVSADGTLLSFMTDIDVYSLIGNALDNALECVLKEESDIDKYINVYIKQAGSMVKIQIENCASDNIQFVNGLPVTTKKDKLNHGFGVKSIRLITERYGGISHFELCDKNKFILEILFPM